MNKYVLELCGNVLIKCVASLHIHLLFLKQRDNMHIGLGCRVWV